MQRITIALDDALVAEIDSHLEATGGSGRSEAIRDLVRRGLSTIPRNPESAECYGVVSCAIDQSVRNLAARVPQSRLDRHDQTVVSLSVPIDHSTSVDVVVMRGLVAEVSSYAEALFLQRGVMHGALGLIPVAEDSVTHVHADGVPHVHTHLKVKSSF
jgi:CopG family nickel-responsive transcriptional regulator